jgi:uncharacterized protein
MGRLVVLIILAVLVVWLVRRALRAPNPPDGGGGRQGDGRRLQGDLVACAHCGVYLPQSEARAKGGATYCSEEHARLGRR